VFSILLLLYWVLLYPILRADRYYNDDLKRSLMGRTGWDSNGRPLTTFVMKLLQCYDHALVDISPLTQIAAIGVLAYAGVLITRRHAIRSPVVAALIAFPLGAQPFFLENLSYKFDSLSMAMALLLALLPVIGGGRNRGGWWPGVLSLFASMALYQPAINAFLVFILLELLVSQLEDHPPRQLMRRAGSRVAQLAAAAITYQVLVGSHIHGWVAQNSELVKDPRRVGVVGHNVVQFVSYIAASLSAQWWRYCTPLLAMLAVAAIAIGVRYAARQWRSGNMRCGTVFFAFSAVLPALAIGCIAGPMLLLVRPLIMARVLVGVGPLLVAGLLSMRSWLVSTGRSERWSLAIALPLVTGMCVIGSAYGNAMAAQKQYEDGVASLFVQKMQELRVEHPIESFLVDGTAGLAPATQHVATQFPLVRRLVLPYIDGNDNFLTRNFLRTYAPMLVRSNNVYPDSRIGAVLLDQTCWNEPAYANDQFDMFLVGTTAVLAFRDAHQRRCSEIPMPLMRWTILDRTPVQATAQPLFPVTRDGASCPNGMLRAPWAQVGPAIARPRAAGDIA
jgi:hypothetical protein